VRFSVILQKKPSNFSEINPQSELLSQFLLKKTLELLKNQPAIKHFYGPTFCHAGPPSAWAALSAAWPRMGQKHPKSLFSFCTV
jgi:hypothetical protein